MFLTLLTALVAVQLHAADYTGKSVVLIYNTEDSGSLDVAEHYATKRNVPLDNIVGLKVSKNEEITRDEYIKTIQDPLLKELEDRKLFTFKDGKLVDAKIRFAALCYGVPLKISADKGLKEEGAAKLPKPLQRNEAAVDNELAWLPRIKSKPLLAGHMPNHVFGSTNVNKMHPTNGVLMVARIDGPTVSIAKALVDKALTAETNGHWGRAYFDLRGIKEGDLMPGEQSLAQAAYFAELGGLEVIKDEKPETFPEEFPLSHVGLYAGWYDQNVSGPFKAPKVEFLPGAIAYHLHSFSGATVRGTNSNWIGPLLAKGASATMGTVYEPYLSGTPHMGLFVYRLIRHSFSFAEAAYASQSQLSWMTTVVGDPLYRPYLRPHREIHEYLVKQDMPLVDWSILRIVNINTAKGIARKQSLSFLAQSKVTPKSAVLLEKMAAMIALEGDGKKASQFWGLALKQPSSRQQRIRIMLQLGDYFASAGEKERARQLYGFFIKTFPDYPKLGHVKGLLAKLQ